MRRGDSRSIRVALVSDFFCPNAGGVETHLYRLSHCLSQLHHEVIVITHAYGNRKGVRYLSNGVKVYYLPFVVVYNECAIPSIFGSFYWLREVFNRERIQLVHGHSTFSTLAHEAILHAWSMGLRTVLTDHSLFGFADASAILTNKFVQQFSLINVDRTICVSYTSKENTVLRSKISSEKVSVIPNAIDTEQFSPDINLFHSSPTTVIVLSRLVYRKGVDLLAKIIPKVCEIHSSVRFVIGGAGSKRIVLEEMREKFQLFARVIMLGALPHNRVRDVLVRGHIFLNTSLTEAFCMSIVEAASCGLHVVSTNVGGISEVLPKNFVHTVDPIPEKLCDAILKAIEMHEKGHIMNPYEKHLAVSRMYNWLDVAGRTEAVYASVMKEKNTLWIERVFRFRKHDFGMLFMWIAFINKIFLYVLDMFWPPE